jgi:hypothetical protein
MADNASGGRFHDTMDVLALYQFFVTLDAVCLLSLRVNREGKEKRATQREKGLIS